MYYPSSGLAEHYSMARILKALGLAYMLPPYGEFSAAVQGIPYLCPPGEAHSIAASLRAFARAPYPGSRDTRGDLVFWNIAPMALEELANAFANEETGKPEISLSEVFGALDVQPFLWWHSTRQRRDLLSGAFLREVITSRFEAFPRMLALSLPRWEHDGCILWRDEAEKQTALSVLSRCTSPAMRDFIDLLWHEAGGNETFTETIWPTFVCHMNAYDFASRFSQGILGAPGRHGRNPYTTFLSRLHFRSTIDDFYDYTKEVSIPLLQQALQKLGQIPSHTDLPSSPPASALAFFSTATSEALELLVKNKFIPTTAAAKTDWFVVKEIPPTLRSLVPSAIGMTPPQIHQACGIYGVHPEISPEELGRRGSPTPNAMHELTHVWSGVCAPALLPPEVVHFWPASTISQESCALLAEFLYVLERPTPANRKKFLQMMLLRDARLLVEVDFHLKGASFEEILALYLKYSPYPVEHAMRDVQRACFGQPLAFAGYAIGRESLMSCQNLHQMCLYNLQEGGWVLPPLSLTLNPQGEAYDCLNKPTEWMLEGLGTTKKR